MLRKVGAFAPGHVSGLFYMQDKSSNPLYAGSLGAGYSLLKGITTNIEVKKSQDECGITINGVHSDAPVSRKVLELFFNEINEKPIPIDIKHVIETPQGSGFGTSAGGALSLSMALNHLYGEPLNMINASKLAHVAEVCCKTGLGTVMGEFYGGFRILTKVGAPGIGASLSIPYPADLYSMCVVFGPISTKDSLSDPAIRERVMEAGKKYHNLLSENLDIDHFLEYSRAFTEDTMLYTPGVRAALDFFTERKINASMLMFGDGIFSVIPKSMLKEAIKTAEDFSSLCNGIKPEISISRIAKRGAGIVSED